MITYFIRFYSSPKLKFLHVSKNYVCLSGDRYVYRVLLVCSALCAPHKGGAVCVG